MKIYIPTRGRPDRQKTAEALEGASIPFLLVVSQDDKTLKEYVERWGSKRVVKVRAKRISDKRQAIVNFNKKRGKILMLDDDLTFYVRKPDGGFTVSDQSDVMRMVGWFSEALRHHAHVGLTDKFMSQNKPRGESCHGRYNQALGYNLTMWPSSIRFTLPINEEHEVHLRLATEGLPPLISNELSKSSTFYAKGGCSTWRTPKIETQGHRGLAKMFPDYVKVVPHKNSISGLAVRVNWKKAVEDNL